MRPLLRRSVLVLLVVLATAAATLGLGASPAVAGTVTFASSTHAFGEQRVETSSQAELVLTNTGSNTQVGDAVITGTGASSFSRSGCGTTNTIVLASGESCVLTVTFTPTSVGSKSATLSVVNDGTAAATVSLTGTGVQPTADLSATEFDLGEVELGSEVSVQLEVSNNGNADLEVGDWSVAGDNGDFSTGSWCQNSVITAGSSCGETIYFAPQVIGLRSAELTIETDLGPRTVTLTGTGIDSVAPTVSLSTPTAPFTLAASTILNFAGQDGVSGSGLVGFGVRKRTAAWNSGFGDWQYPTSWSNVAADSLAVGLSVGRTSCFSARSRDGAGNVSGWSAGRCTARPLGDRSLVASTGWARYTGSSYYLGTVSRSTTKGATLTRTSARLSRVALVVTKCPTCGSVGVYVGSTLVGKVSLASATKTSKVLVVLPAFSLRSATVTVKVLTSAKPVLIEGLGIFRAY